MKNILRFALVISLFFLGGPLPKLGAGIAPPAEEPEISMDFQDAGLKDLLKVFSIQSGMNFIASEAVQERKITLYLDKVPLKKAMERLFKANNLSYELDKDSNIFIVKEWGKLSVDTQTKVFFLKHATVSTSFLSSELNANLSGSSEDSSSGDSSGTSTSTGGSGSSGSGESGITQAVNELISSAGSVIEDARTNSLIVTDTPERLAAITEVINALDVRLDQVMLEVEMLDVSKNSIDRLGIKWTDVMTSSMFEAVLTGAQISTKLPIPNSMYKSHTATTGNTFTPGSLDFSQLTWKVFFDFIKQQADTKILARPRILTLNNEPAEIKVLTEEAIGTITTTQGQGSGSVTTTSAERVNTGVSLRVTPQVDTEKNEITMFLMPSVKDATTSTFNSSFKDPEERTTKSIVRVKDGETVIIGGLIRKEKSEVITKMPLLGDIPLLGGLFRHKYKDKDKDRELLVFITPHIIKNSPMKLAQAKKVVLPEREQGVDSRASREFAISSSLNSVMSNKK